MSANDRVCSLFVGTGERVPEDAVGRIESDSYWIWTIAVFTRETEVWGMSLGQ